MGDKKELEEELRIDESLRAELEDQDLDTHICCIYRSREEQLSVLSFFMSLGIEKNEKCLYREEVEIEENYLGTISKLKGDYSLNTLSTQLLVTRIQNGECDKIKIDAREREEDILLKIEDDGKRLPKDIKNLFTGNLTGETTGFGGARYYMNRQIAEHNDGRVEVQYSELGGARVDIYLKKAEGKEL